GADGVAADAGFVGIGPAEGLLFDGRAFGLGTDVLGGAGTVGLAEGVAAGDKGDGLFVVHGHAGEGLADVLGGGDGVRLEVGAFGVHGDEAHVGCADGLG